VAEESSLAVTNNYLAKAIALLFCLKKGESQLLCSEYHLSLAVTGRIG